MFAVTLLVCFLMLSEAQTLALQLGKLQLDLNGIGAAPGTFRPVS